MELNQDVRIVIKIGTLLILDGGGDMMIMIRMIAIIGILFTSIISSLSLSLLTLTEFIFLWFILNQ